MSEQQTSPDVLARRLDQALPARSTFIPPSTPDPLVNTAVEIARLNLPPLSTQASSRIESQVMAVFDTVANPTSNGSALKVLSKPRSRWPSAVVRYGLVAGLVLIILMLGLTPSVYASVPGEPLYSVKQLYENVELFTAATPRAKTEVYLQHAEHRAAEALTLLERRQFDSTLIDAALQNIDAAAATSSDTIRSSPQLRNQVLQVSTVLDSVMTDAQASGLTTAALAPLERQVNAVRSSDLLIALPPLAEASDGAAETPASTDEALISATDAASDCASPGKSCLSQGVPGGNVIPGTPQGHRPTREPPANSQRDNNGSKVHN